MGDELRSGKTTQSWHDIAEKLSAETDCEKIAKLSEELIRAIDEATETKPAKSVVIR